MKLRTWSQIKRFRKKTGEGFGERYPVGCKSLAHLEREARRSLRRISHKQQTRFTQETNSENIHHVRAELEGISYAEAKARNLQSFPV